MTEAQKWAAGRYDDQFGFVSAYGETLIAMLNAREGERILDLGCGTGDLAVELAGAGAKVTGYDLSGEMIERARAKYPEIDFAVRNAADFRVDEPFDAIFSNAALHWVLDAEGAVRSIAGALRPGGRFVAEFGGAGNVAAIATACEEVLREVCGVADAAARNPWYFPTTGQYASLLESYGMRVTGIWHYDRPTPLNGEESGMRQWLAMFGDSWFAGLTDEEREAAVAEIERRLRPRLHRDGMWTADYVRLRVTAVKV